jgi:hypothetical protein
MAIVTALIVVFSGISLLYLWRNVGGKIKETELLAIKLNEQNKVTEARQLREQAEQIRSRMDARVPIKGSLSFLDSRGNPHSIGIDVGQEQSMKEPRSHIEGATPSTAIWSYGIVPDPFDPNRKTLLDRRIPVDRLLPRDSLEWLANRIAELEALIAANEQQQKAANLPATKAGRMADATSRSRAELQTVKSAYAAKKAQADDLAAKAKTAESEGHAAEAAALRRRAAALHAPPIALEMTFNVYRTTKGRLGEAVFAEMKATNPVTHQDRSAIFPIREYYTNKQFLPASLLVGSRGALRIEIRCVSPTQYLGMAESDLYIKARSGDFNTNFIKALFGVWLQAMVLTAIGVFAGTFLSWPVALLTTIAFFLAGQVAFSFLLEFTQQSLLGGGPFESLIRLLSHENQTSELAPTLSVVTAKTLDALVMPVMSRLVFIVPNFSALDVSNTVAEGFAVGWDKITENLLLALAYVLPFSVAGYFILKNREVAA